MKDHHRLQDMLYEYVRKELNANDRKEVEIHLAECGTCRAEVAMIAQAFEALPPRREDASVQRSQAYWESFAGRVEERLHPEKRIIHWIASLKGRLEFVVRFRPALAYSIAGSALVVLLTLTVWLSIPGRSGVDTIDPFVDQKGSAVQTSLAVKNYFEDSRMLLIGIVNRPADERTPVDLSVERTAARNLVHQARYLADQPIDAESAELIGELQRILVELANLEESADIPDVEMIRTGVRQENVLFRIRMAEHVLDRQQ